MSTEWHAMMLIITANLMTSCFLCDSGIKLHSGNLGNGASHLWQRISSAYRPHGSHNYKSTMLLLQRCKERMMMALLTTGLSSY